MIRCENTGPHAKGVELLSGLVSGFQTGWDAVLDFALHPYCYTCERRLASGRILICEACWRSFSIPAGGLELPENRLTLKQKLCFSKAFVLYVFSDKIMQVIHLYKYNGKKSLGNRIGSDAGRFIPTIPELRKAEAFIPVPLHRVRLRERGYNQSELIARRASEETGIPVLADCTRRVVDNPSQTGLTLEERKENVKGIFRVTRPEAIKGKTLILIDDVITTGVTMNECARMLLQAGAQEIFSLAVIHPGSTI